MGMYYLSNTIINFLGDGIFLEIVFASIFLLGSCLFMYGAVENPVLGIVGGCIFTLVSPIGPFYPPRNEI